MVKKFHITVTYDGRQLVDCDSSCAALIGEHNAATCCITNDIAVRIVLAAKVKVYLNSLIRTILTDTPELCEQTLEDILEEVTNDLQFDEERIDPTECNSKLLEKKIERFKKAWREDGGGNG